MSLFAKLNKQYSTQNVETTKIPIHIKEQYRYFDEMPQFIQDYLMSRLSLGYSKGTIQRYVYDYKYFFDYVKYVTGEKEFEMSEVKLADFIQIDQKGIENYVEHLAIYAENNAKTINRKLSSLKSLFDYLKQQNDITANPVDGIERPKIVKRDPIYLQRVEYEKLMAFILSDEGLSARQLPFHQMFKKRDLAIIHMMMMTGLRISELCQLKMMDIDFIEKEISVNGKGNKQRSIPLNDGTSTIIGEYINSLPTSIKPTIPTDSLFIGFDFKTKQFKSEISISAVQKMLSRHLERAKKFLPFLSYKHITAHKLRHSFATELVYRGVDVLTVQNLLGHESVATTQIYAHVQNSTKKKAVSLLN